MAPGSDAHCFYDRVRFAFCLVPTFVGMAIVSQGAFFCPTMTSVMTVRIGKADSNGLRRVSALPIAAALRRIGDASPIAEAFMDNNAPIYFYKRDHLCLSPLFIQVL